MAQSDARFGYYAKLSRQDHELGRPFGFTTPPGSLCPIFTDLATPGDTYYIKHDLTFLRTMPLAAPAMVDVEVHFESFFVPFMMLYQPFEDTLYSMKTQQSTLFNMENFLNQYFPLLDYENTIGAITAGNSQDLIRLHQEAFRLADFFGLQADNFCIMADASHTFQSPYQPNFFPWKLLAYQCIFQYYYRLDDKSNFDQIFNFDDQYAQASAVVRADLFKMHQRPWDFDYYTSMYRSPIVSEASMQAFANADLTPLTNRTVYPLRAAGSNISSLNNTLAQFGTNVGANFGQYAVQAALSTANIRQMFAREKFAMITGRARKTYDAQVMAHFGYDVPHDPKHDIALIGQDHYPVHIGEVTSLASTTDAALGDLAGKGWSQGEGKQHKFTAPCHGVIMTIFSIEPKRRYYGGFDRDNIVNQSVDVPTPENDRLGNVPMFRYESGDFLASGQNKNDVIGWKERYYPWKRKQSKTTLAFMKGTRFTGTNSFESYMIATLPFGLDTISTQNSRPDLEDRFYIQKNCMDSLMLVSFYDLWKYDNPDDPTSENWDKSPFMVYARDPFIVDSYVKCKKVSWMSKDGEPIYNF